MPAWWRCTKSSREAGSRILWLGMDVVVHFRGPFEEAPEAHALPPDEFPELQESNLLHLHAAVGLDAPEQVRAAPRRKAVPAGGVPEKSQHIHGVSSV